MTTSERFQQVQELFHAALKVHPAERQTFLSARCPEDESLRQEVESLLAEDANPVGLLHSPSDASCSAQPAFSLSTGSRLGPYEISGVLGAGGMGEVYRAHDTKLHRDVALKILPEGFANDPERISRFQREAQLLASLNHPHIAAVYGLEDSNHVLAIAMELVQGPTLAERIAVGPIAIEESLGLAKQIAEAVEAAHARGIVHRDLKPANVKISSEGAVKVLDFGVGKALKADSMAADSVGLAAERLSTRAGVILGTPAYMSPEQARGLPANKQADIWSFGVLFYEMLTGRATFAGETVSDTLASVLKNDPEWSALPGETPPAIRRLLRRCLERDRKRRLRDIGDALIEIDDALAAPADGHLERGRPPLAIWAIVAFLLASMGWLAFERSRSGQSDIGLQVSILPPESSAFTAVSGQNGGIAVSPDGRSLAYAATQAGKTMLWVRRLDSLVTRPLAGTQNGSHPFWSPDNGFLGFIADSKLQTIDVSGGLPQVIGEANRRGGGGAWNREGTIVFSGFDGALYRVSATKGQPSKLTALDPAQDYSHFWPYFLPDGRHFLYVARNRVSEGSVICVGSIDAQPGPAQRFELVKANSNAVYVPSSGGERAGWLLFARGTTLVAQRFDAEQLKLEGEAATLAEGVGYIAVNSFVNFSAAKSVLVYSQEGIETGRLTWLSTEGNQSAISVEPGAYFMPRLSPDGARLAVTLVGSNVDIWQIDLMHGIPSRFTFDPAAETYAIWSPDGKQIVFASSRDAKLYRRATNGDSNEERITEPSDRVQTAFDWSRDGRYLLYAETGPNSGSDLWILPLAGDKKPVPFLQTSFNETQGQFSPDGRWVAYSSDESSRYEVYVRSFTGVAGKVQISNNGGTQPRWRGDGKELYYLAPDGKMMAVRVKSAGIFERETPRALFEAHWRTGGPGIPYAYDVTRDGRRFLGIITGVHDSPMTLVTNWQARLKKASGDR